MIPTGSMRPEIQPGDSIRFRRTSPPHPLLGEIWVARRGKIHIVHRVLWLQPDRVLLKGDWNLRPDPWLPRSALFGPVSEIQHAGRWRPTNRRRDRALGLVLSAAGSSIQGSRFLARRFAGLVLGESRASALAASVRQFRARLGT